MIKGENLSYNTLCDEVRVYCVFKGVRCNIVQKLTYNTFYGHNLFIISPGNFLYIVGVIVSCFVGLIG